MAIKKDVLGTPETLNFNVDAFGRYRTSQAFTVFDDKHLYGLNDGTQGPQRWLYLTNGNSSTATYTSNEVATTLSVGVNSGDYSVKQSRRYLPYVPGKSQLLMQSAIMGSSVTANTIKRLGYFDDSDGLYFFARDGVYGVGIRSKATGSVVDLEILQSAWNQNKGNGTGEDPFLIDFSKAQVFFIDFEWLGVGNVRWGVYRNGKPVVLHQREGINQDIRVYMAQSSLPIRNEIRNTGTGAQIETLKTICCTLISEGGEDPSGVVFTRGTGTSAVSCSTRRPVMAVRLANTFGGKPNRKTVHLHSTDSLVTTNPAYIEISHHTDVSTFAGTFTEVYSGVSAVQMSTDCSTFTGGKAYTLDSFYVNAAAGNTRDTATHQAPQGARNVYEFLAQDDDSDSSQYFVIYGTGIGGSSSIYATLTWEEIQ